jgi:hypothetical protein
VILSVGMVVDATVVVLENIVRVHQLGRTPGEAAVAGTDEVRLPVLAGAATTLIVLIPLLFLTGFVGKTFGPLAETMLYAFGSSVAVALVVVPVASTYALGAGRLDRAAGAITGPFRWLMDRLRNLYLALLARALRRRLVTVAVAGVLLVLGIATLRSRGMEVLPAMDGGSFFVSVETPSGSSLEDTEAIVREIEALLRSEPEVVTLQSQVGFEPGMRSMSTSGAQGPTQGMVTVTLSPRTERDETIWSIEERVRRSVALIPGIHSATVRELGNTAKATTAAPVVVRLSGGDPLVLDRLGDEVLARVATVPGVVEPVRTWRLDQRRYRVDVDILRAGELGLSPAAVAGLMQSGSVGVHAGIYDGDGPEMPDPGPLSAACGRRRRQPARLSDHRAGRRAGAAARGRVPRGDARPGAGLERGLHADPRDHRLHPRAPAQLHHRRRGRRARRPDRAARLRGRPHRRERRSGRRPRPDPRCARDRGDRGLPAPGGPDALVPAPAHHPNVDPAHRLGHRRGAVAERQGGVDAGDDRAHPPGRHRGQQRDHPHRLHPPARTRASAAATR